jgi:hydroxymethylbilane synthase
MLCVPAPGQGIVAAEIRADDEPTRRAVSTIDDQRARAALTAERALVVGLGGGCQTPIGALATIGEHGTIDLVAVVAAPDGSRAVRAEGHGVAPDAEKLGARVAADLIELGADDILAESRLT